MPSPEEILSLLCSAGLYDMAVSLTLTFNLSRETVLASVAVRCVSLAATAVSVTSVSGSASVPSAMLKSSGRRARDRDGDFADFSAFADFFLSASNLPHSADFRSFELSTL